MKKWLLVIFVFLISLSGFLFFKRNVSRFAVYYDNKVPSKWVKPHVSRKIADFLRKEKFKLLNRKEISRWLKEVAKKKIRGTVLVFSQDIVPCALLEEKKAFLLRRYLEQGGNVVWIGEVPFAFCWRDGKVERTKNQFLKALGIPHSFTIKQKKYIKLSAIGKKLGLRLRWKSLRSVSKNSVDFVLAFLSKELASGWIKLYSCDSGIIRIWDSPLKEVNRSMLENLVQLAKSNMEFGKINIMASVPALYKKQKGSLMRAVMLDIENWTSNREAEIFYSFNSYRQFKKVRLRKGRHRKFLYIPNSSVAGEVSIRIKIGREIVEKNLFVKPGKKWKIFFAPSIHTDIGFTAPQEDVMKLRRRNIDKLIEAMGRYPNLKWNIEVSYLVKDYLAHSSPEKAEKLIKFIKEGRIEMNAIYLNVLTGLCSGEALNRLFYFSKELSKREGFNLSLASITDVPTYVWTLPMLLRNLNIKFFVQGFNSTRAPFSRKAKIDFRRPFWWEGFGGKKILTFASSYGTGQSIGLHEDYSAMLNKLPKFLSRFKDNYPYDEIFLYGYLYENRPIDFKFLHNIKEWNRKWEYPRIIISTNSEFFRYFLSRHPSEINSYRFDGGTYWEDGAASTARETSIHRKNQREILNLEKILSLIHIIKDFPYPVEKLKGIWEKILLFNEHTWGALQSVIYPRLKIVRRIWKTKANYAYEPEKEIRELKTTAAKKFSLIFKTGKSPKVIVFNPLSWSRKALVKVKIPEFILKKGLHLVDESSGLSVPYQVASPEEIVFVTETLPPFGYKSYLLLKGKTYMSGFNSTEEANIENRYYKVKINNKTGEILSIFDKELGINITRKSKEDKFNRLVYSLGGSNTTAVDYRASKKPQFSFYSPEKAEKILYLKGPIETRTIIKYDSNKIPNISQLRTEITLYKNLKMITISNKFHKEETLTKEALYYSFPFKIRKPQIVVEVPNGYVRPEKDQIVGSCKDWYSAQNWVALFGKKLMLALTAPDSPLFMFGGINAGKWLTHIELNGRVFAYLMNNYWNTNYKASQGGDFSFRFFLFSSREKGGVLEALRKGWEFSYPPMAFYAPPNNTKGLIEKSSGSFLKIDRSNIVLAAMKIAEQGEGLIIRLREVQGKRTKFSIYFPLFEIKDAFLCDIAEEERAPLKVYGKRICYEAAPFQLLTLKLKVKFHF